MLNGLKLNPVAGVWNHTEYSDLANYVPDDDDIDELYERVEQSITEQRSKTKLLQSFFKHAKLEI